MSLPKISLTVNPRNSTKLRFAMDVNRISITEHVFHLLQYFNVFTRCTICQKILSFSCLFTYRSNPFCRISIAHWSNGIFQKPKNVFTLLKHYWCFSDLSAPGIIHPCVMLDLLQQNTCPLTIPLLHIWQPYIE